MRLATPSSCSRRSRSPLSWSSISKNGLALFALHSSSTLPPHYAVNVDVRKVPLPSGGLYAQRRPSVVNSVGGVAGYDHVTVGCLIVDGVADV